MDGQLLLLPDNGVGPRRLSVSALVDLRRCPRRFAFAFVEGHPRRAPAGGLAGAAVHRAIQDGHMEVPRYAGRRLVAAELPVRLRRRGFVINGRIDAVYAGDGERWELVDFKSGAPPASPDAADDAQLEIYALAAVEELGRPADSVVTTYLYLATGEVRTRDWSETARAEATSRLDADLDRIEASVYEAVPNRGCGTCDALPVCPPGLQAVDAAVAR